MTVDPTPYAEPEAYGLTPYEDELSPWYDVARLIADGIPEPPAPEVARRRDGGALFYKGQVNVIFGDPESGKTWLAYAAVVEQLSAGGKALVIDADHNGGPQVVSRLLALGATPETLSDLGRFRLLEPEDKLTLTAALDIARAWLPDVVIVDSIGEVLPMVGANSNSPDDYTHAHRLVLRPLAVAGAAVIGIDHLAKNPDSRQAGPSGTAAKARAIGGLSVRCTVREPFAPGRGGSASLTIRKDRPGGVRATSPTVGRGEQPCGVFVLTNEEAGGLSWHIATPTADDAVAATRIGAGTAYSPTSAELAEIDALPPQERTVRGVKSALSIGTDKARAALDAYKELHP